MEKAQTHPEARRTNLTHFRRNSSCERAERFFFNGLEIQLHLRRIRSRVISSVTLVHLICSTIWSRRRVALINDYSSMYVCTRMIHILRFVIELKKLWTYFILCRAPRRTTQNTRYTTYIFSHGGSAPDQHCVFSGQPNRRGKRPQDRPTSSIIIEITHDYTRTSYSTESPHRYLASIFHLV